MRIVLMKFCAVLYSVFSFLNFYFAFSHLLSYELFGAASPVYAVLITLSSNSPKVIGIVSLLWAIMYMFFLLTSAFRSLSGCFSMFTKVVYADIGGILGALAFVVFYTETKTLTSFLSCFFIHLFFAIIWTIICRIPLQRRR